MPSAYHRAIFGGMPSDGAELHLLLVQKRVVIIESPTDPAYSCGKSLIERISMYLAGGFTFGRRPCPRVLASGCRWTS